MLDKPHTMQTRTFLHQRSKIQKVNMTRMSSYNCKLEHWMLKNLQH